MSDIEFVGCHPNGFAPGRKGQPILAIMNHVMQGTLAGTIAWFQTAQAGVAAHYGIGKAGRVVQFVRDEDTAYANGPIADPNVAVMPWLARVHAPITPNHQTLAIEWEGSHEGGEWVTLPTGLQTFKRGSITRFWQPTEPQYQAGLRLIRNLTALHAIPRDRGRIGRHSDVDSVKKWYCPGPGFPLGRMLHDLGAPGF